MTLISKGDLTQTRIGETQMLGILAVGLQAVTALNQVGSMTGMGQNLGWQVLGQVLDNGLSALGINPNDRQSARDEAGLSDTLPGNPGTNEGIADMVMEQFPDAEPSEIQSIVEEMQALMDEFLMNMMEEEGSEEGGSEGAEGQGGSWIMVMARKLGGIVDKQWDLTQDKINEVASLGEEASADQEMVETSSSESSGLFGIGGSSQSTQSLMDTPEATSAKNQMPSATAEMQGQMQQFSLVMSAATTAIKTAGEASSAMARKQ